MIIRQSCDADVIKSIVTEPMIWDRIAQDMYEPESYEPSCRDLWLIAEESGEVVGVCAFDNLRGVSCDIHPYILPKHRMTGREVVRMALGHLFGNFDKIHKVNASIPVIYKSVLNFALKCGFSSEGINRHSFMKNGLIHDQYNVGITRGDYEHC